MCTTHVGTAASAVQPSKARQVYAVSREAAREFSPTAVSRGWPIQVDFSPEGAKEDRGASARDIRTKEEDIHSIHGKHSEVN